MASPRKQVLGYLDTVGDGSGNVNMNVDGSSTPVDFYLIPDPARGFLKVSELMFYIEDAGTVKQADLFGALAALSTGIQLGVYNLSAELQQDVFASLGATFPAAGFVKDHGDFRSLFWDIEFSDFASGNAWVCATHNFSNDRSGPLFIQGNDIHVPLQTHVLSCRVNDDLTGLINMRCFYSGVYER